jgi:hypothetical protein
MGRCLEYLSAGWTLLFPKEYFADAEIQIDGNGKMKLLEGINANRRNR